ncbi:unnamed protein product, partial [Medioppia subpectinata]
VGYNECNRRHIEDSETVCVCNATHCDQFPPLSRPKIGYISVFESNRNGDRFKESALKFKPFYGNINCVKNHCLKKSAKDSQLTITVDKNRKYQKIYGFGGAFTDSAGYMLSSVDPALAAAVIDSYYSATGIEFSFGRVPIGGTDYSLRPYTYADAYNDKQLKYFSLQKEDFEWKMPYIKRAQSVCPHTLKLIASNWCPPVWMKQIEQHIGYSELKGEIGGEYYQILANYIVKFLDAYKENGITMWGLTTQNEPAEDHQLNNMQMSPESLKRFIEINLGPTLAQAGYNKNKLKLMILDDNTVSLTNWTDTVLTDNSLLQYVSGIANHWYYNERLGTKAVGAILEYVRHKHPDYFVINTEACVLDGPGNGKWSYAERYAIDIINQLNHWAVGWIEWNLALDVTGGPTWFERQGCGGPVYIDPLKGEAYKQPSFYSLGHFSKFVSPDSVRIGHEIVNGAEGVHVLTAKRPDNGVVVVALNAGDTDIELNINNQNNWVVNKLPSHSIQSYIWH